MAGAAPPGYSSGGMVTKLAAARIAMAAGCRMADRRGRPARSAAARRAIEAGARGTWFLPAAEPRTARKAGSPARSTRPARSSSMTARRAALRSGKSLLPAGVVAVEGSFERGDCVVVRTRAGTRGRRAASRPMPAPTSARIAGHKSGEIEAILGYRGRDEMIHRDDLVVTERR